MLLRLADDDPRPLYEQIASAIRAQVADGTIVAGDRLPAGRDLAAATGVTLQTVQRAYRTLADEGTVSARVGRGTVVAADVDPDVTALIDQVDRLIAHARALGTDRTGLTRLLESRWNG
ncbi:MAG: GntR family transcriptional regulator [Actinomycetota bacterium]